MKEVFIIERLLAPGIWELFSNVFFTKELEAIDECLRINKQMQQREKNFCARVTKLETKL